ncbi:hypothetical protein L484_007025 [Morus notabilis]|uniref:Uncharacterized protein n=1 Tax=Morus notabilis TaxID=981085 RepID=W9RW20_9ROSA|nr:hypothetical protein L484_007025 [Morus notabilis]
MWHLKFPGLCAEIDDMKPLSLRNRGKTMRSIRHFASSYNAESQAHDRFLREKVVSAYRESMTSVIGCFDVQYHPRRFLPRNANNSTSPVIIRNLRHRIIPLVSLSGSVKAPFNDVSVDDPDFGSIQALAEAGVVSSKLAHNSANNGFKGEGDARFSPDIFVLTEQSIYDTADLSLGKIRFISRQDLIDWRTQLEYQILPGLIEQAIVLRVGVSISTGSTVSTPYAIEKGVSPVVVRLVVLYAHRAFGSSSAHLPFKSSSTFFKVYFNTLLTAST